jgi:tRNA pseudouridine38-40 synthase
VQRYFLRLTYKGTKYHGWQVQANALSVQTVLEGALSKMLRTSIQTTGCGRTDTGVHALDFYAHFDSLKEDLDLEKDFIYHLNCVLPDDIAGKAIQKVHPGAHARFDAISRTYEYRITFLKNPFLKDRAMLGMNNLDLNPMREACQILFDYSDFGCFSKNLTQVKTNICQIKMAEWEEIENGLVFRIQADRFLRNMVRAITGTMLDIGKKRITLNEFRQIIEGKNRADAGASVPACGLYLTQVEYPAELFQA